MTQPSALLQSHPSLTSACPPCAWVGFLLLLHSLVQSKDWVFAWAKVTKVPLAHGAWCVV